MEPSHFLILELKNEEEIDQFLNHSYLNTDLFKLLDIIIHLSPKHILENPKFT